jgi:hypothetical protein
MGVLTSDGKGLIAVDRSERDGCVHRRARSPQWVVTLLLLHLLHSFASWTLFANPVYQTPLPYYFPALFATLLLHTIAAILCRHSGAAGLWQSCALLCHTLLHSRAILFCIFFCQTLLQSFARPSCQTLVLQAFAVLFCCSLVQSFESFAVFCTFLPYSLPHSFDAVCCTLVPYAFAIPLAAIFCSLLHAFTILFCCLLQCSALFTVFCHTLCHTSLPSFAIPLCHILLLQSLAILFTMLLAILHSFDALFYQILSPRTILPYSFTPFRHTMLPCSSDILFYSSPVLFCHTLASFFGPL